MSHSMTSIFRSRRDAGRPLEDAIREACIVASTQRTSAPEEVAQGLDARGVSHGVVPKPFDIRDDSATGHMFSHPLSNSVLTHLDMRKQFAKRFSEATTNKGFPESHDPQHLAAKCVQVYGIPDLDQ